MPASNNWNLKQQKDGLPGETKILTKKQRVIKALSGEFSLWEDEKLDDFARELLAIPPRPEGNEPYGWLLPQNNDRAPMSISPAGINLIKKWEGFRGSAYLDPVGIWTIGYGHTKGVKPGQVISESEALNLLILATDLQCQFAISLCVNY